jgi:hypothetical protein
MPIASAVATGPFSPDVLDFVVRQKVDVFLDTLLTATREVFPTSRDIRVLLESDPEIAGDWHIVFEVRTPENDVPDYVAAQHRWTDELFRICPAPLVSIFRLALLPV